MRHAALLFSLFIFCTAKSQNWIWAQSAGTTGSSGTQEGMAVCTDKWDNVAYCGYFGSVTISFGSSTYNNSNSNPSPNIFVAKYDASGNVLWAKTFGDTGAAYANDICMDTSGNVFITGFFFSSTLTFGNITLTGGISTASTAFIAKLDALSGAVLWARGANTNINGRAVSIAADEAGNAFICGFFAAPAIVFGQDTLVSHGFGDGFLVKYDPNGNVLWARNFGGTANDNATALDVDQNGNAVVTGLAVSSTFYMGNATATGSGQVFLVKYDPVGNPLWGILDGQSGNAIVKNICLDPADNIYLTGYFHDSTVVFGTDTLWNANPPNQQSIYMNDLFFVRYHASGSIDWSQRAGQANKYEQGLSLASDHKNGIYLTGSFADTITFGTTTLTQPYGPDNGMIVQFDTTGSVICANSSHWGGDDIWDICVSRNGNVYLGGDYWGANAIFGSDTLTSAITETAFLARYECAEPGGMAEPEKNNSVNVFPNPFSSAATLEFSMPVTGDVLELYDVFGRKINEEKITEQQILISHDGLANGIYFYRVVSGNKILAQGKLVAE